MKFADVILPLALPKNYTYAVPPEWANTVRPGVRVAVQLGRQKKYAGVVKHVHDQPPVGYNTKPLLHLLDEEPIVYPAQLAFWEWIAGYYMCTEGEVMNAALPAHLKLSSETILLYNEPFGDDFSMLDDDEYLVAEALLLKKELAIAEVQQILDKVTVYAVIKGLIEKKVCLVFEELKEAYKEKKEHFVQLNPQYQAEAELSALFDELARAPKQLQLLMAFIHLQKTQGEVSQSELLKKSGATPAHLKGLAAKNILFIDQRTVDRLPMSGGPVKIDFSLTEAQQECLAQIRRQFEEKTVVLLHGVTSSGKTQLYIKLIEEQLQQDRQVLYLLPEIALTSQIIRRLQKHFGSSIGIYHSRFNNNERVEIWNKVKSGEIKAVLGARSSLLLPFRNLSLVILDEEQDASYKQQEPAPRYHARDAAIYYAAYLGAKVLLGSATPSVESYFNAQQGKYGLVTLSERYGGMEMPEIILVDAKQDAFQKKSVGHFTSVLKASIEEALCRGQQVILFQNRRGYAPYLICTTCGWIPYCEQCNVSLTYHKQSHQLQCHYCGTHYPYVYTCGACGTQSLVTKSFGTEKIEDDLLEIFPAARVARMDLDAVKSKDSHNKLIQLFEQHRIDILVGTQMVVKGLDFEKVALVGILNADSLLNYPDFRVNERAFQLMEQVSGRAGRKTERGKVIVQAGNLKHPVLQYVVAHDYQKMYEAEIVYRRQFLYPPFSRLLKILIKHKQQDTAVQAAHQLAQLLRPELGHHLVGPAAPLVNKVRNYYLMEILVKLPRDGQQIRHMKAVVQECFTQLKAQKPFKSVWIVPDVDCV